MLGEIDTSDAMESAISRMLNRRDAEAVSFGWTIIHFPCSREISLRQTLWILPEEGLGLQFCFNSCLCRKFAGGHGLFEGDLVIVEQLLDDHFVSVWLAGVA